MLKAIASHAAQEPLVGLAPPAQPRRILVTPRVRDDRYQCSNKRCPRGVRCRPADSQHASRQVDAPISVRATPVRDGVSARRQAPEGCGSSVRNPPAQSHQPIRARRSAEFPLHRHVARDRDDPAHDDRERRLVTHWCSVLFMP